MAENTPAPEKKTPYENETKSLPGLPVNPMGRKTSSNDSAKDEADALAKLNAGIAGVGDKLGKGFTGSMAAGIAAHDLGGAKGGRFLIKGLIQGSGKKKKGLLMAGGGIGGMLIALLVFFMSSLPFGFKSIMTNMVDREMKVVKANMGNLQDSFASHYIKKFLIPGMQLNGCTSTLVDRNCAVTAEGDGPLDRMFRAWQKGNIEERWARAGFEIRHDRIANRYFIRATGVGDVDITRYTNTNGNLFNEINRRDLRAVIRDAHRQATFHDRIMLRWGLGDMLRNNYNVRRCVLTCKVLDAKEKYFTEPIELKKQAAKMMLIRRVLMPRSQMLGIAFRCVLAGSDCDPNRPDVNEETGEYRTQYEREIQADIRTMLSADDGDVRLARIQEVTTEVREKGFRKYLIEQIVKSLLSKVGASEAVEKTTAKVAGQALPVLGTAVSVMAVISAAATISTAVGSINTQMTEATAISVYGMDSTYADEIGSANVDMAMVGSFADSFSPGQERQGNGEMGGAGAGAVPLYNAVVNNGNQTQVAFSGLFGAKVYAAGEDPNHLNTYKCPISGHVLDPSGRNDQLICPEQALKYGTYIVQTFGSVDNFLNAPGISVITQASTWVTKTIGDAVSTITKPLLDVLQSAPGYEAIAGAIAGGAAAIFDSVSDYVFPNWINDNMSGATRFVASDLGARASASAYGETVLRGHPLTPEQVHAIETEEYKIDEIRFKNKPLYARMFDQDDPHSFVTRLSLSLPTNFKTQTADAFTELISDPFTKIVRGFGSVFSGQRAFAAPKILPDPFGVKPYGRVTEDSIFNEDPQTYWASRCTDTTHNKAWNEHVSIDPDLKTPYHTQSDNCAFLQEGTKAGGAFFDSSFIQGR